MFSKIINRFFLKKIINKRLNLIKNDSLEGKVATIGIIIDETKKSYKDQLLKEIQTEGMALNQVFVLVYKDSVKSKEVLEEPFFTSKNVSLTGIINKKEVVAFLEKPFDVLINYYDENKPCLLLATTQSKAKFKIGFDEVDYRANHFIVKATVDQVQLFTNELFKYLRILKKL